MIVEAVLNIIFNLIYGIISIIPDTLFALPDWTIQAIKLLRVGLAIFPTDVWVVCIGNGLFWLVAQFQWAIIEWIYKKIPGVS